MDIIIIIAIITNVLWLIKNRNSCTDSCCAKVILENLDGQSSSQGYFLWADQWPWCVHNDDDVIDGDDGDGAGELVMTLMIKIVTQATNYDDIVVHDVDI